MRRNLTIFILIFLIGVLMGYIVCVSFKHPSRWVQTVLEQSTISGLQTYRNNEYGFSFKYPNDLSIEIDTYHHKIGDGSLRIVSFERPNSYSLGPFTEVYFFDDTIESAIRSREDALSHKILDIGDFVVAGHPAKIIYWTRQDICNSQTTKDVYIQTPDNKTLIFTVNEEINLGIGYSTDEVELFQKILPTVVF